MSKEQRSQSEFAKVDDLELEDTREDGEDQEDFGPPSWVTQVEKFERSVFELHRRWRQKRLDLQPDFQRDFVWTPRKQVRLVESVLAKIPLPAIYLSEETEVAVVIDGQQRLTTLFRYMDDLFPLEKSRFLDPSLYYKRFSELPALMQRRFEDAPLICFVVQRGSHPRFKFELFERLNQGATNLLSQEIRDAIYQGHALDAIREFADNDELFQELVRKNRRLGRGADRELVLRGVAWLWRQPKAYSGDLKDFLNTTLDGLNKKPRNEIYDILERLRRSFAAAKAVFGIRPFDNPETNRLNAPLLDMLVHGFDFYAELAPWMPRSPRLGQRLNMMWEDPVQRSMFTHATDRRTVLQVRMQAWLEILAVEAQHDHEPPAHS